MFANVKRKGLVVAGALLLALTSVAGAWAQGAFYREVAKDGRIFVFNNAKEFVSWEKSGEIGKAITLLNYGPNGETVVADSVEAVHLYNFKNNRPGDALQMAEQPAKPPKMSVTWKDGKTTIETDKALMNISNRVQMRWTDEMPDEANTSALAGTANPGDSRGSFRIRRSKLKLDGWAFKKTLQYEFQVNWAELGGTTPGNVLEDANLNWDILGNKRLQLKGGQFKVPFGRQELTSSGAQQFVDRSIVAAEFLKGRDAGVQVWGLLAQDKLEYRLGAFNGNGRTKLTNDNAKYQINGRLQLQPWGDVKLSESDFESTDRPLIAFAGNFEINDATYPSSAGKDTLLSVKDYTTNSAGEATKLKVVQAGAKATATQKRTVFGGDAVFKYKGLSVMGEYFDKKVEPYDGAAFGESFKVVGYHTQVGYLFAKRTWEVAFRYATWDPTDKVEDDNRTEIGGALNYFYAKHNLKVQADFRQVENQATKIKDQELRLQTQIIF